MLAGRVVTQRRWCIYGHSGSGKRYMPYSGDMKYKTKTVGRCYKDIRTSRKITNQSYVILIYAIVHECVFVADRTT